ncbi:MAG: flagellar basal body rod protein FlgC [Pseudomonadota bacterium]|jgi:flagellar basal-body rod protein FlgC|nr:flagellar basal body rod protein FlgC [Pseudomonadota bacterium]
MGFDSMVQISAGGMSAQRFRLNVIAGNLANQNTTRTPEGGAYRRRDVVFQATPPQPAEKTAGPAINPGMQTMSVEVAEVITDPSPLVKKYQPGHPDADSDGYVAYPNINTFEEMVNMLSATRSYEANATIMKNAKEMADKTLELLK